MKNLIGKLGNLGELRHLDRDTWIVMAINSVIDKQNEIIDYLNSQDQTVNKKTLKELEDEYLDSLKSEGVQVRTPSEWMELHDLLKPYHQEGEDYSNTLKRLISKLRQ